MAGATVFCKTTRRVVSTLREDTLREDTLCGNAWVVYYGNPGFTSGGFSRGSALATLAKMTYYMVDRLVVAW